MSRSTKEVVADIAVERGVLLDRFGARFHTEPDVRAPIRTWMRNVVKTLTGREVYDLNKSVFRVPNVHEMLKVLDECARIDRTGGGDGLMWEIDDDQGLQDSMAAFEAELYQGKDPHRIIAHALVVYAQHSTSGLWAQWFDCDLTFGKSARPKRGY